MRAALPLFRFVLLVSIAGSAASLTDDTLDTRPFCGFESGCDAVTGTGYGHPLGIPLSAVGLAGFGLLFALTLFPAARSFVLVAPLAALAGVTGLALIGIQAAVLDRFCPLCLLVDGTAIAAAALALGGRVWRAAGSTASRRVRAVWAAGAVVAAVGPFLVGWASGEPPVPDEVKAHWVEGAVTMVEVTDFDCPACRQSEPALAAFRQKHPEVRFVRLVAPMPAHKFALPAGRAFLAARAQGRAEEMAALLMAAENHRPERCRQIAVYLGLDLTKYDQIVSDQSTDAELDATLAWVKNAGTGLPLVWIQGERIQGVLTDETLTGALKRARTNPSGGEKR